MSTSAQRFATSLRDRWLLPLWIVAISLWRAATGDHSESMWMSREGTAVLQGAPLSHPDTWGWAPQPWDFVPTSPAWELLASVGAQALGVAAFPLLAFAVAASTLALQARISQMLGASQLSIIVALGLSSTLAGGVLTSRAGTPAFALLLAEFALFWRIRAWLYRAAPMLGIAASALVSFAFAYTGIWLHGSWTMFSLFAAGGIGLLMLSSDFDDRRHRLSIVSAVACASVGATLVGPLGINAWSNAIRVGTECAGLVREWTSPWQLGPLWSGIWLLLALLLALGLRAELRHRRQLRREGLRLVLLILTIGAVVAGAIAIRFLLLGILAAAPLLALWLTRAMNNAAARTFRSRLGERGSRRYWQNIAALLVIAVTPLAAVSVAANPIRESAAIAALPRDCQLFSDDFDAKAIEYWRPDVRVWIDGRQDYWGRARILETNRYRAGEVAGQLVPTGTTCVVLSTADRLPLARALDASAAWSREVRDTELTLWVLR